MLQRILLYIGGNPVNTLVKFYLFTVRVTLYVTTKCEMSSMIIPWPLFFLLSC